jgi:hypothetical protein
LASLYTPIAISIPMMYAYTGCDGYGLTFGTIAGDGSLLWPKTRVVRKLLPALLSGQDWEIGAKSLSTGI